MSDRSGDVSKKLLTTDCSRVEASLVSRSEWERTADGPGCAGGDRTVGIVDIADPFGGTEAVYLRIAGLRGRGLHHAANCIERELGELDKDT